jgi:hypothetical protein
MVGGSLRVLRLLPPQPGHHDIAVILLKEALKHQRSNHFKNRNILLAEETGKPENNSSIVIRYGSITYHLPGKRSELRHLTG